MENDEKIPDKTKWRIVYKFPFFNIPPLTKIDDDPKNRIFWGFLDIDIKIQIGITFISTVPIIFHILVIIPEISLISKIISCTLIFICYFLFLWSYYASSFMDPGFLPFDYAISRKPSYNWQELLSGTTINEKQEKFAIENKPYFASFSRSMGRYVIRADHICGWINNWVGRKNHKQFILFCFWGIVFSCVMIISKLAFMRVMIKKSAVFIVFSMLLTFYEISYSIVLIYTLYTSLRDLLNNTTKVQSWKGENGSELSPIESMQIVFGKVPWYKWLIPTPAFSDSACSDYDTFSD